jgi:hypothetical protein
MVDHEIPIEQILGLAVAPPAGNRGGYVLVDYVDAQGRPASVSITPTAAFRLARALVRAGFGG